MLDENENKRLLELQTKAREEAEQLLDQRTAQLLESNTTLKETIDELESKRQAMVQQEKLASIGLLAAGIAHEINNPIGFVKSNLEVLKGYNSSILEALAAYKAVISQIDDEEQSAELSSKLKELNSVLELHDIDYVGEDSFNSIRESLSGAQRVQDIVSDLKDYSRNDNDERIKWDLHEVIEGAINLANIQIKQNIEIVLHFGDIPQIYCCASQLTQVFINLIMNAAQAMEYKGTLEIHTTLLEKSIQVEFIDSGPGIDEENLRKLFDPFFTTKDVGLGTGLGLYVSHGLIQKHRGSISAENVPGGGAKLIVKLPIDMRGKRER